MIEETVNSIIIKGKVILPKKATREELEQRGAKYFSGNHPIDGTSRNIERMVIENNVYHAVWQRINGEGDEPFEYHFSGEINRPKY